MLYTLCTYLNVTPYIHTIAITRAVGRLKNFKKKYCNGGLCQCQYNLLRLKLNWNRLSTVFLLVSMWIYVSWCCCSITSVPGPVFLEQFEFSMFPITHSRNRVLGTNTSKLSVPYKLFPEQQIWNRKENLLFPISCSGNAVPGTEEVHQTYLLQLEWG